MEGRLRKIERTIDQMMREIESAGTKGSAFKSSEAVPQAGPDSAEISEDRETMVVFRRRPKDEPSPGTE